MKYDIFADMTDEDREKYAGKVLLLSNNSENVIFFADTLEEVENFLKENPSNEWMRIVQGPLKPGITILLNDIEDGSMK